MTDFADLRKTCEQHSRISKRVVDDFLLGFAGLHQGLEKTMNTQFGWYREVSSGFDKGTLDVMKSQFIIHKVFRAGGLIHKFLKNPALKHFRGNELEFLQQQAAVPWRFSYAEIMEELSESFFRMRDVFSNEEYLLFSPSISHLNASGNYLLWFNLIGFNGSCWQSYGPIGAFRSFSAGDILFFATERNPEIEEGADVCADIDKDPLPYMMLLSGSNFPRTFNQEHEMIYQLAEYDLAKLDTVGLKKSFTSEYDNGVYRFTDHVNGEYPHFAQVYYDESLQLLLFTAMTEWGFRELVRKFNTYGYDFPEYPFLSVRAQMIPVAEKILKRRIEINEYHDRFTKTVDPESAEELDRINNLMALVLPDINAGRQPDIEAAAKKAGVSPETARELLGKIMEKFEQMPGRKEQGGRIQNGNSDKKKGGGARPGKTQEPGDIQKKVSAGKQEKEAKDSKSLKNNPSAGLETRQETFRKIYSGMRLIWEMEPWRALFETDLFGIEIPGTDRVYFISVMGHNLEFTAIAAYKGYDGLADFYELQENADKLSEGSILTIPHLLVSFNDREELEKADLDAIRQSGETFRGRGSWPKLEEIIPGYIPAFPEGDSLQDLPVLLEQIMDVLSIAVPDPDILYNKFGDVDDVFLCKAVLRKGTLRWENQFVNPFEKFTPINYHISFDRELCAAIAQKKASKETLQVDLFLFPAPVKEKNMKAYFPFVLLLVDKESGLVRGMATLSPHPDLHSMYESISMPLLEELNKMELRPERIELHSELLLTLTMDALKLSMCMPVLQEHMPQVDQARQSLFSHLL